MGKMQRGIALLLALCLFFLPIHAFAQETQEVAPQEESVSQPDLALPVASAVLMEASTGKILYAYNEDEARPPASVTKIMTLLLVLEAIDSGKIALDDVVVCSATASQIGGSQIWLEPGEEFTVHELLKATAIASANDAATQLAEYVAGSVEAFVDQMNQRAKELGMEHTNFVNPTGLDADGHVISAEDIAIMSRELIKHDLIFQYSTVWTDTLRNGASQLTNTNKLLKTYSGITGLKTGTTNQAGYCLSATANRDGMELIAVVMGSPSGEERFDAAKKLLDYGYNNYALFTPQVQDDFPTTISVEGGVVCSTGLDYSQLSSIVTEKKSDANISYELNLPESVAAPLEKGQEIGTVIVMDSGTKLGEFPIKCNEDVAAMTFLEAIRKLFYFMVGIPW